jgi:hypothetical protein
MGQSITVEVSNTTLLERKIKMRWIDETETDAKYEGFIADLDISEKLAEKRDLCNAISIKDFPQNRKCQRHERDNSMHLEK